MRDNRSCTCHPDEAPKPCQRHFGLSECFMAAEIERLRAALREIESNWEVPMEEKGWRALARFMWKTARAALEGK